MPRNVDEIIASLPAEERRARELTQVEVAKSLGIAQKQISELERRTEMQISTLRRSIEAMGGKVCIIAEFPNRELVLLKGIAELGVEC